MSNTKKTGAVRLFTPSDAGQKHHGWRPVLGDFSQGLVNPNGWAALHVVVQKLADGVAPQDMYDQLIIVENPGAIAVCQLGDSVGLVQNFRFTAERLFNANKDYVRKLVDEGRFAELLESLGRYQWELPRGLSPADAEVDLTRYILQTAKVEAQDEAGLIINNPRIVGRVNPNSTFFAHAQYVVVAEVERQAENAPEAFEMLGKTRLFTKGALRKLVEDGQFDDGLSLAALALAGFSF